MNVFKDMHVWFGPMDFTEWEVGIIAYKGKYSWIHMYFKSIKNFNKHDRLNCVLTGVAGRSKILLYDWPGGGMWRGN